MGLIHIFGLLAINGAVSIFVSSRIFFYPRRFLGLFSATLATCHKCLGFWFAIPLGYFLDGLSLEMFLFAFASSAFSFFVYRLFAPHFVVEK